MVLVVTALDCRTYGLEFEPRSGHCFRSVILVSISFYSLRRRESPVVQVVTALDCRTYGLEFEPRSGHCLQSVIPVSISFHSVVSLQHIVQHSCKAYFRVRSAWRIMRAATLRLKLQIKLYVSPSHCMLILGQLAPQVTTRQSITAKTTRQRSLHGTT